MSFFTEPVATPLWLIVFVVACAVYFWARWFWLRFKQVKAGKLARFFSRKKTDEELRNQLLEKAKQHIDTHGNTSGYKNNSSQQSKTGQKKDPVIKQNIRKVLQVLADSGESGCLLKSISDKTSINARDVTLALKYLIDKSYAEETTGAVSKKYYLTSLGRKYCINKKYIVE